MPKPSSITSRRHLILAQCSVGINMLLRRRGLELMNFLLGSTLVRRNPRGPTSVHPNYFFLCRGLHTTVSMDKDGAVRGAITTMVSLTSPMSIQDLPVPRPTHGIKPRSVYPVLYLVSLLDVLPANYGITDAAKEVCKKQRPETSPLMYVSSLVYTVSSSKPSSRVINIPAKLRGGWSHAVFEYDWRYRPWYRRIFFLFLV